MHIVCGCVCLHSGSNYLKWIINKMENVSKLAIIGNTTDRKKNEGKKKLLAKVTPLQQALLQRWSHHILKCKMKSLVIHRLNHMNKRSKGKFAD